jgi:hypothetical protein
MIRTLAPYVAALLAVVVIGPLIELALIPLFAVLAEQKRSLGWLAPIASFFAGLFSLSCAMLLFIGGCHHFHVQPSFLMFLLPSLVLGYSNFNRIEMAKLHFNSLDQNDIEGRANAAIVLKMDQFRFWGDFLGIWIPLFVSSAILHAPIKVA